MANRSAASITRKRRAGSLGLAGGPAGGRVMATGEAGDDAVQLVALRRREPLGDVVLLVRVAVDVVVLGLVRRVAVLDVHRLHRMAEPVEVVGRDADRLVGRRVA